MYQRTVGGRFRLVSNCYLHNSDTLLKGCFGTRPDSQQHGSGVASRRAAKAVEVEVLRE
jgi:hypothetical protein